MKIIRADAPEFREFFQRLRRRGGSFSPEIISTASQIVHDVSVEGDEALFRYTKQFDGHDLSAETVEVTEEEKQEALYRAKPEDREVIELAARRIEEYHRHQFAQGWSMVDQEGAELGQVQ